MSLNGALVATNLAMYDGPGVAASPGAATMVVMGEGPGSLGRLDVVAPGECFVDDFDVQAVPPWPQRTFYVAPGGVNNGIACTNPATPAATIQYAVDLTAAGDIVKSAGSVQPGDTIDVTLARGTLQAAVTKVNEG